MQRFLYVGNRSQAKVMVFDRKTLDAAGFVRAVGLGAGRLWHAPSHGGRSKGNLYVTEVTPLKPENRRVQKFVLVN